MCVCVLPSGTCGPPDPPDDGPSRRLSGWEVQGGEIFEWLGAPDVSLRPEESSWKNISVVTSDNGGTAQKTQMNEKFMFNIQLSLLILSCVLYC